MFSMNFAKSSKVLNFFEFFPRNPKHIQYAAQEASKEGSIDGTQQEDSTPFAANTN